MAVFKTPQLPDDLDPGTLTDGMVPLYDVATERWVPGVPDSGTSGTAIKVGGSAPASGWWLDNGTPEPDPDDIPVTATGPTWTDDAVNGGGTWTTPTETGITYSPASGTATPGQTVTVTATAQSGYYITGTASWAHTFPAAPAPGATPFADDFNRADTTELSGMLSPTNDPWAMSAGTNTWHINSNTAVCTLTVNQLVDVNFATTDATVEVDVIVTTTEDLQAGVTARRPVGVSNTYYHARINAHTGTLDLFRFIGGAATLLDQETDAGTYGVTGTHRIGLTVTEGTGQTLLTVTHNGTPKFIDVADATSGRPNGTRFGMRVNKTLTHVRFDNFTIDPI